MPPISYSKSSLTYVNLTNARHQAALIRTPTTTEYKAVLMMNSWDIASDVSTKVTLEKSSQENKRRKASFVLALDSVTFVRRGGRYCTAKQTNPKCLLAAVGILELANTGDFAANIWNQVPVPHYAVALMALSGTLALSVSYFALKDAQLSWRNLLFLHEERRYLRTQKHRYVVGCRTQALAIDVTEIRRQ